MDDFLDEIADENKNEIDPYREREKIIEMISHDRENSDLKIKLLHLEKSICLQEKTWNDFHEKNFVFKINKLKKIDDYSSLNMENQSIRELKKLLESPCEDKE